MFARWRDALGEMRPAYYRLVIDWPHLQPSADKRPNLSHPETGCLRDVQPCATWHGVRDQLKALASRQREGGWEALVVIAGTPDWAADRAHGCERAGTEARSRPPTDAALPAYRRLIAELLEVARQEGAELRYWSPWNEPNHPFFLSPQRARCDRDAPSLAVDAYVRIANAMKAALDEADGDQDLVLGELSGLPQRRPKSTGITEFIRALPNELVCAAPVWSQHGYIGGPDSVEPAARALQRHRCKETHELWITETGVGAPRLGEERRTSGQAQMRACERMHRRLLRWYDDPRVTAAFQYTLREDDRFPTGLVTTSLSEGYPALAEWQRWGAKLRPEPRVQPPQTSC